MRAELFRPSREAEARLLLLIDGFTTPTRNLEGRTKLAKLDFFLRYPNFMRRAMQIRKPDVELATTPAEEGNVEARMVRYRYGPWDPSYFALLGSLIGRGLIDPILERRGIGFRSTSLGREVAGALAEEESWGQTVARIKLLRRHFDLTGRSLQDFIYEHFPEVTSASWGERL